MLTGFNNSSTIYICICVTYLVPQRKGSAEHAHINVDYDVFKSSGLTIMVDGTLVYEARM